MPDLRQTPIARDHYTIESYDLRRDRYYRPWRGLAKHAIRLAGIVAARLAPRLAERRRLAAIDRERTHARVLGPGSAAPYLSGPAYMEMQIGKDTRPAFVLEPGATVALPCLPDADDDVIFGVAPVLDTREWPQGGAWGWQVGCGDSAETAPQMATRVPCAGPDSNVVYFPGDGWIDVRLPVGARSGQPSVVVFTNPAATPSVPLSISAPQIMSRRTARRSRHIVVLSVESLTAPEFLRARYAGMETPHLAEFGRQSVDYPLVYSVTDSTLPYAGSMLTGLMPSQHAIGDYSVGADTFLNRVVNRRMPLLQETVKGCRYVTCGIVATGRFGGKVGWARGFDSLFQEFYKWAGDAMVGFDAITGTLRKYREYDTYVFAHIDYLHDPLLCIGSPQGRSRVHEQAALSSMSAKISPSLYAQQLSQFDRDFGEFVRALKSAGMYDNTGLIVTGDHGCGLNWVKHSRYSLYDERLRVPLIVKPPDWAGSQPRVRPLASSVPEIHRTLRGWLDAPLEASVAALPQYRSDLDGMVFAETIMNPNRDYRRHCMAVMKPPFKYLCWNRIDWDSQTVESFGDEMLYRAVEGSDAFDESVDRASDYPAETAELRAVARSTVTENLAFLRRYRPELY